MQLFISWSGEWSKRVAVIFRDWIPLVVQSVQPYMSAEDIEKGARWSGELAERLEECSFGIICLTPDNLTSSWVHFEAGALAKSVERSRVSPFLFGLSPPQVIGPLVQFQATETHKDDILRLIESINRACGDSGLGPVRLERVFEAMWPELEVQLGALAHEMSRTQDEAPMRDPRDMLEEVLQLVRGQSRILATLGQRSTPDSVYEGSTHLLSVINDRRHHEHKYSLGDLVVALDELDPRARSVIDLRFGMDGGGPRTLQEVGDILGLSVSRVRQIEARLISKLDTALKKDFVLRLGKEVTGGSPERDS